MKKVPRPGKRNYLGELAATIEDANQMELALGTNSRSGGQWRHLAGGLFTGGRRRLSETRFGTSKPEKSTDQWPSTGASTMTWSHLRRDWSKLGPKLEGKIHIYVGEADNYFLNNAVYLVEDFLKNAKNPYYAGEVDYERRAEHCWNGDHTRPNAISRLRYHQFFAPKIVERIFKSALRELILRAGDTKAPKN